MTTPVPVQPQPRRPWGFLRPFRWVWKNHLLGALGIIIFSTWVIAGQVSNRTDFASTELAHDVESRWGAPVNQAAPSVRAVQSGTVFTELAPLALASQHVDVTAVMNYRKRGLAYFSGFDFVFDGTYLATNPETHDIDVAFVFPLELNKSQVLLSELAFTVDGQPASLDLGPHGDRLVWTGRIPVKGQARFSIRYRARGLESFVYQLDPSLPARDVKVHLDVEGGDNVDYPSFVLAASDTHVSNGHVTLDWTYPSLESGVALGVTLPSLKKFDQLVAIMAERAFVPGLAFVLGLTLLALKNRRSLQLYETWLCAAAFGFTYVLLAYLGAFVHFYLAWLVTLAGLGAAVTLFLHRLLPKERRRTLAALWVATQVLPTFAVAVPGYTGLLYTLELLALLLGAMVLLTRDEVRTFLSDLPSSNEGAAS